MIELKNILLSDSASDIRRLLNKCKMLARATKSRYPIHPQYPDFKDMVPPRDIADELVQAYLRTFEPMYRIVHIPTFEKDYLHFWSNPQSASTAFIIQLLLVMAIGTAFYRNPSDIRTLRSSALQWIDAAQTWVSSPFFVKARVNLISIQINCLLLMARFTCGVSTELIWISAGSLLRTAMYVALHRDPRHLPGMTVFQAELRRRLWATVLEIVVQTSIDSGGSPLISFEDFDCEAPSNIDDVQMTDDSASVGVEQQPLDVFTQSSAQIILTKSLPLRLKIAKITNDLRPEIPYDEILRLDSEYRTMLFSNNFLLQSLFPRSQTGTSFQRHMIDIVTHRFLLTLHLPHANRARSNPMFYYSRKTCVESAVFLYTSSPSPGPLSFNNAPNSEDDDFTCLRLQGGQLRCLMMYAEILIGAELITQTQESLLSPLNLSSTSASRRELRNVLQDNVDFALKRIKARDTNIKAYAVTVVLLAQADAIEAGEPVEQAMMDAFRVGLENSCEVLQSKLDQEQPNNVTSQEQTETGRELLDSYNELDLDDLVSPKKSKQGKLIVYVSAFSLTEYRAVDTGFTSKPRHT